jgi:hypothetical protein
VPATNPEQLGDNRAGDRVIRCCEADRADPGAQHLVLPMAVQLGSRPIPHADHAIEICRDRRNAEIGQRVEVQIHRNFVAPRGLQVTAHRRRRGSHARGFAAGDFHKLTSLRFPR